MLTKMFTSTLEQTFCGVLYLYCGTVTYVLIVAKAKESGTNVSEKTAKNVPLSFDL
jgi:hypothetical protein